MGAVHRQLGRLAETELVTVTRSGNQKHYQARRDSPVFEALHSPIVKTVGVAEPLRQALRYPDLFEALQEAETVLGRTINPTVMTVAQWRAKRAREDSFAARVAGQERVFVIGSDDDLG